MGENIAISVSDRPNIEVRSVTRIEDVGQAAWDALDHGPSPFLKYGFLRALELSGSIGSRSGWYPCYLLAEVRPAPGQGSPRLVGAVAAFVKSHSYGEYIFDWAWASASERAGIAYYPKLVIAAPHTPATGRRILLASDVDPDYVTMALAAGVNQLAEAAECSSVHWLFCTAEEQARLSRLGFLPRASFQFHWHNRDYRTYEEFLDQLTSRKRKQLRKERRRAVEALDGPVEFLAAAELGEHHLEALDRYYRNTVWEHGGTDYLRPGFFHHLAELLPEHMYVAQARRGGELVAGALFLETGQGLFGRYWGCDQEIEFLHFETAYYAGIERCIERGIPLFEAGAQGEHKLLRGFLPSPTYSCHWLRHPGLAEGIAGFLDHERQVIRSRMAQLAACGPYRSEDPSEGPSEKGLTPRRSP